MNKPIKESRVKTFIDYIPALSIVVIVFALIKQILYFKNFNVPIKYFTGLSELGMIISDDLLLFIPILLYCGFLVMILKKGKSEMEITIDDIKKGEYLFLDTEKGKRELLYLRISILIFILILILLAFYTPYYKKLIMTFPFISLILLFLSTFFNSIFKFISRTEYIIILIFVMLTGILITLTGYEIIRVENGKYNGTLIYTSDTKHHTSTDSSYFIGKTEKYVFIYNKFDTTTTIIPSESVTQIIMKSK